MTASIVPKTPAWPEPPSPVSAQAFSSCTAPETTPPRHTTLSVGAKGRATPRAARPRAVPAERAMPSGSRTSRSMASPASAEPVARARATPASAYPRSL